MALCKICSRRIEETMEGTYGGACVDCLSDKLAKAKIKVGTLKLSSEKLEAIKH